MLLTAFQGLIAGLEGGALSCRIPLATLKGRSMEWKAARIATCKTFFALGLAGLLAASGWAQTAASKTGEPIRIVSITYLGNKKITTEQLQKAIATTDLKIGGEVNFSVVAPAMKAVLALYKQNGVSLSLSPDIIEDPKGIAFVQFIIDENGTGGDVGGLVSSGGPFIFCRKPGAQAGGSAPGSGAPGGGQGGPGGAASGGGTPGGSGAPGGSGGPPPTAGRTDFTPVPSSGIVSITFLGNKKVSTEELKKVVDGTSLKLGVKVGPDVIAPAMKAVVSYYQQKGVSLSLSPDIIEDAKGISAVQFIVDEDGLKGDIGGLVSSGGPHIFCEK
jgi:uncharacterized membrane protein YgcG